MAISCWEVLYCN